MRKNIDLSCLYLRRKRIVNLYVLCDFALFLVPPNMQTNRTKIYVLWQKVTQVKTLIHSTNRFLDFLFCSVQGKMLYVFIDKIKRIEVFI